MKNTNKTTLIAGSILLGFGLVAAALFFSGGISTAQQHARNGTASDNNLVMHGGSPMRDDAAARNIYGNPEAEIVIVEFSDYECPYCSRLHPTLKKVVDESDGAIKWEYRHLPLAMHKNARPAAIAAECVGQIAGSDAFWEYSNVILTSQQGLSDGFLQEQAEVLGVDAQEYQGCLTSEVVAQQVTEDEKAALSFGGSGTPFSVIVFADGTTKPVSGALPYEQWAQLLNI